MQIKLTKLDLMRDEIDTRGYCLSNAFNSDTLLKPKNYARSVSVLCSYDGRELGYGHEFGRELSWHGNFR